MNVISALQQLGFSEYEAKAYLAVLKQPESNGYELAKFSGIPRAKIYETLDSLQRKGALLTAEIDNRQCYRALPYQDFLSTYKASIENTVMQLQSELSRIAQPRESNALYTVQGEEKNVDIAKSLVQSAKVRLLLTGFTEDIATLLPEVKKAQERGVRVDILNFGESSFGIDNVYDHPVSGAQYLQVAAFGRWLAIIRDNEEALLTQMRGCEETIGFLTRNEVVILGLSMWVFHDIQLKVLSNAASPEVIQQAMQITSSVQDIIFWEPSEVPPVHVKDEWPSALEILQRARARLAQTRLPQDVGVYRFDLSGEGGGVYELKVLKQEVTLSSECTHQPDLVIKISVDDFRAMAVGKLPLAAFTAKGRISVQGDLSLASNLQRLLR